MIACSYCAIVLLVHLSFYCFDSMVYFRQVPIFSSILKPIASLIHCEQSFLRPSDQFMKSIQAWFFYFQGYFHFIGVEAENYSSPFNANFETESYASLKQSCWLSWARDLARLSPCFQTIGHHCCSSLCDAWSIALSTPFTEYSCDYSNCSMKVDFI